MARLIGICVVGLMALPSAPALAEKTEDKVRMHITSDLPIVSRSKWEECQNLNAILRGDAETDKTKPQLMQQCKNLRHK